MGYLLHRGTKKRWAQIKLFFSHPCSFRCARGHYFQGIRIEIFYAFVTCAKPHRIRLSFVLLRNIFCQLRAQTNQPFAPSCLRNGKGGKS